jgi:hypothetical protein
MVTQIEQMLVDAWKKFCDYYDTKAPQYRDICQLDEQQAREAHWICWDESDLMLHIGRFFYDILSGKKEKEFLNIEMHLDKNLNRANFKDKDYEFANRLDELKERLIKEGVLEKGAPKVDMIVARENSNASLLLCAEAKCFRGTKYEKPIPMINADITKLNAYRDLGIAKEVVFILFDDYYYCHDTETANAIQQRLNEIRQDGITVLFHTSEAKLRKYKQ